MSIDLDGPVPPGSYFSPLLGGVMPAPPGAALIPPGESVTGDFLRSAVGVNYVYDSRDSNITPRKGEKIDVGVTVAGQFLGGDIGTYTVRAEGTKHWNLWWDTILTLKGEMAVVDTISSGDMVPVSDLLALGGARTLRGFEFREHDS